MLELGSGAFYILSDDEAPKKFGVVKDVEVEGLAEDASDFVVPVTGCGCFYTFDDKSLRPSANKRCKVVDGICFMSTDGDYLSSTDLCIACTIKPVRFLKNEVDILEENK